MIERHSRFNIHPDRTADFTLTALFSTNEIAGSVVVA